MSWNQGGGPWGGGGGQTPWGRAPRPPNIEDILRKSQDPPLRFFRAGWGRGRGVVIVVASLVLLWVASGFYRVQPDEQGIVLRFGAYKYWTPPGLHWHIPWPVEEVERPAVTRINRSEIGYRSGAGQVEASTDNAGREMLAESLMLTG